MGKLKVLHVSTAKSWRGGEQQLAYLMEELNAKIDQWVICTANSSFEEYAKNSGFNYFSQSKSNGFDIPFAKRIAKICKERQIDIIHTHDSHAHTFAFLSVQLFSNRSSIVVSRRVDFPIKKGWLSKLKYNHSSIKKIVCVSNAIKEITKAGINDFSKLEVVHSGIDLSKFSSRRGILRKELSIPDSTFLIGNTSALADHKDYFTFLSVAKNLIGRDKEIQFVVLGKGPLENEIKAKAKELELGEKVIFAGFRNNIPAILADLDLFLISSKTEGLGTSIIDAFAAKVPVVATAAGGIPELVENEVTGLLNPIYGISELTESVQKLKTNKDLRVKLTENAFEKAKSFDKEVTAKKTLSIYYSILKE